MQAAHLQQEKQKAVEWAQQMLSSPAVIVDFETTDIKFAEIIQIGVIDMRGNTLLETFVKPNGRISSGARRVHGISDDMVAHAPPFNEIYVQLSTLLAGQTAIAYNAEFDRGVLRYECQQRKLPVPKAKSWACAMKNYAAYYGKWNNQRYAFTFQSLSNACIQQHIDAGSAHQAIGDCLMTLKLIQTMAGT